MISKIEFRPHVAGYRSVNGVDENIEFDQWILLVDDGPDGSMLQAGYVQKKDNGGIMLIRRFNDADKAKIHELVQAEKGTRKKPSQPPAPIEDEEDDEDDE